MRPSILYRKKMRKRTHFFTPEQICHRIGQQLYLNRPPTLHYTLAGIQNQSRSYQTK